MAFAEVSRALQHAYHDGAESANGKQPCSRWDWTKPISLVSIGPSSVELQPLVGVVGQGRATLPELDADSLDPAGVMPPADRYEASKRIGWFAKLKEATPEKYKNYQAQVITDDGKVITGTVHGKTNYSRIWNPLNFVDLAIIRH